MPFEEANAQTELMNELTRLVDTAHALLSIDTLRLNGSFSTSRARLEGAVKSLIVAQDAIGYTARLSGQGKSNSHLQLTREHRQTIFNSLTALSRGCFASNPDGDSSYRLILQAVTCAYLSTEKIRLGLFSMLN